MRYIPVVLFRLAKVALVAASLMLLSPLTEASVKTRSTKANVVVSNHPAMKAWLKRMPQAFREIGADNERFRITNIDIKWKQSRIVTASKDKAKKRAEKKPKKITSYVCEIQLIVQYQLGPEGEESPDLTATPSPLKVNSRCDSYLAKNDFHQFGG